MQCISISNILSAAEGKQDLSKGRGVTKCDVV